VASLKRAEKGILVITDVCSASTRRMPLRAYLSGEEIRTTKTLELLARTALSHAKAGADIVCPLPL